MEATTRSRVVTNPHFNRKHLSGKELEAVLDHKIKFEEIQSTDEFIERFLTALDELKQAGFSPSQSEQQNF